MWAAWVVFREREISPGLGRRVSAYSPELPGTAHYFRLLPITGKNWIPPCVVGIPSRRYVKKKKKKKKLENKKKKILEMGVFSSGKHWGVFGSIREFWGVLDKIGVGWVCGCGWWVWCAPPGLCVPRRKNPPLRQCFPTKSPRPDVHPEIPARPAVLLSSTQPARVDFRPDKIKAPEEYPRGSVLGLMLLYV